MEGVLRPGRRKTDLVHMLLLAKWPGGRPIQAGSGRSSRKKWSDQSDQGRNRPAAPIFRRPARRSPDSKTAIQGGPGGPQKMFLTSSLYLIYLNSSSSKQGHFLWTSHFSLFKSMTCRAPNTVGRRPGIRGSAGDNWDRQARPVDKPRVVPALSPEFSEAFSRLFSVKISQYKKQTPQYRTVLGGRALSILECSGVFSVAVFLSQAG